MSQPGVVECDTSTDGLSEGSTHHGGVLPPSHLLSEIIPFFGEFCTVSHRIRRQLFADVFGQLSRFFLCRCARVDEN